MMKHVLMLGVVGALLAGCSKSQPQKPVNLLPKEVDAKKWQSTVDQLMEKEKYDQALAEVEKWIKLDKKNPQAYLTRAKIYQAQGKFDQEMADLDYVIVLDSENTSARYRRGILYLEVKNNHGEAIKDFQQLMEAKKGDPEFLVYLARAFIRAGRIPEAQTNINQAIQIDDQNANAQIYQAKLLLLNKMPDEALKAINIAVKADDTDPRAYRVRGEIHDVKGEINEAVADFNHALELEPNHVPTLKQRAVVYLLALKDYKNAEADYTAIIEKEPEPSKMYFYRGFCRKELKKFDKAVEDFDMALKDDPRSSEICYHTGYCYLMLEKPQEADKAFSKAIEFNPNEARAYARRGLLRLEQGNDKAAMDDIDKCKRIAPTMSLKLDSMVQEIKSKRNKPKEDKPVDEDPKPKPGS